jgi:hypothetical protein
VWIFCGGMRRSGSTVQFQMTAAVVEAAGKGHRIEWVRPNEFGTLRKQCANDAAWKVFKTHICTEEVAREFDQRNAVGVYVFRDLRDVTVSVMRKNRLGLDQVLDSNLLENCIEQHQRWTSMPRILISKYEEMTADLTREVDRIAAHIEIKLSAERYAQIAAEYSIERQRERIEEIKNSSHLRQGVTGGACFDPRTNLHTNHIYSGEVGGWRNALSNEQVARIEAKAADWLIAYGYELSRS